LFLINSTRTFIHRAYSKCIFGEGYYLFIGKDEKRNPGWYHVVIYYDSGDPERGWVCEWGAAEIAEKELYVQLSTMSEGKPYTIILKEEHGRRWIETTNEAATVKAKQFVRILPVK